MATHTRVVCDRCGRTVPRHAHYRVRIDVVADPSAPDLTRDDLEEADFDWQVAQLLDEMKDVPAADLEDSVVKRSEFRICRPCQLRFLRNPLGRTAGPGAN